MAIGLRPRRSALFVPGANQRALDKSESLPADVLILDLEDSVAPDQKDRAREAVVDAVARLIHGRREVVVRINGLDTPWIARDIAAMAAVQPDALVLPKLSKTEDLRRARAAMAAAQAPREMRLWAMIETPAAILNVASMAAIAAMPSPAVNCFVIGTNDLAAELGARISADRATMIPHLAHVLAAARAHGIAVLDGTYNDLDDKDGCRLECLQGRDLGMDGKTLIHPNQVPIANEVFAPSPDDVSWARRVIEAFAAPENAGKGVITVGGRMVERLHERMARRTLEVAEAIDALKEEPAGA